MAGRALLPTPCGRRSVHFPGEVKLDTEKPVFKRAAFNGAFELIGEGGVCRLHRVHFDGPDIGDRGVEALAIEQGDAEIVDGEGLRPGRPLIRRVAAIHGDGIALSIFVAVIVFEAQACVGAGDKPGARSVPFAVLLDVKGDSDPILGAFGNMHDHGCAFEVHVHGIVADEFACIGFAAMGGKRLPEHVMPIGRRIGMQVWMRLASREKGAGKRKRGAGSEQGRLHHQDRISARWLSCRVKLRIALNCGPYQL